MMCPYSTKNSGSIPRSACVACETAMHDYQERVTTGHTDGQTTDKVIPIRIISHGVADITT